MISVLFLVACSQETAISPKLEAPPQVTIQAPGDGETLSQDDAIEFVGVVTDGNGLGDLVTLTWDSDLDGELATRDDAGWDSDGITRFATTLSPGVHTVTLAVIDSTDRRAEASIALTVTEVNTGPIAEITSPTAFDSFSLGSDITLIGGASDPNQAADELIATWTHEPENGGAPSEIATLSPTSTGTVLSEWVAPPIGVHRIRLTVVDGEGQSSSVEVVIEVEDPNAGDADLDGWTVSQGDCDDSNPDINPAAAELCNNIDDDCNGEIDDKDADQDDHVDEACVDYTGPVPTDDCDDADPTTFTGAPEQADGIDNDCNGLIDDGLSNFDNDGDCSCTASTCIGSIDPTCLNSLVIGDCDDTDPLLNPYDDDGDGYSTCDNDCDDANPALSPFDGDGDGASTCTDDCNDADPNQTPFDVDLDGFSSCQGDCNDGDASQTPLDTDNDGFSTCQGDCDDNDPTLNPMDADNDGFSTCQDDCDDNDDILTPEDADNDGDSSCEGDCDDTLASLNLLDSDSDGYTTCDGDCNDSNAAIIPVDGDGDGFTACQGDCNDSNAFLTPADTDGDGYSTCDGDCDDSDGSRDPADIDNDGYSTCDGDCDDSTGLLDPADADGDGYSTCDGDCNDGNSLSNPGRTEVPYNGIDDDCVGGDLIDVDGDGYVADVVGGGTDCDDNLASVNPGQIEVCGGADENCNGIDNEDGASGCQNRWTDNDGDGYGTGSAACSCDTSGATQGGDCYDGNANAHPSQNNYYEGDRGDGSWDYDCNGSESVYYSSTSIWNCNLSGGLLGGANCSYDTGWLVAAPECGESAEWNTGCYWLPYWECSPGDASGTIYDQSCH